MIYQEFFERPVNTYKTQKKVNLYLISHDHFILYKKKETARSKNKIKIRRIMPVCYKMSIKSRQDIVNYTLLWRDGSFFALWIEVESSRVQISINFYVLDQSKSIYLYGLWEWHLMALADSRFDIFSLGIGCSNS